MSADGRYRPTLEFALAGLSGPLTEEHTFDLIIEGALHPEDIGLERWRRMAERMLRRWARRKQYPGWGIRNLIERQVPTEEVVRRKLAEILGFRQAFPEMVLVEMVEQLKGERLVLRAPYSNEHLLTYQARMWRLSTWLDLEVMFHGRVRNTAALQTLRKRLNARISGPEAH